jgi:cellulose synthase/poly-beta-1,6-N-acetylglucosamine synthase-like glycosyltransferase
MSQTATLLGWGIAIALVIPSTLFFVEVLLAFLSPRRTPHNGDGMFGILGQEFSRSNDGQLADVSPSTPALAILVPAHNEAAGLAPTLQGFRSRMRPQDRLVVVADNCSDDTVDIARAVGAEVVERFNQTQRGKCYALEAGIDYLRAQPPAQVLILDADCQIDPDFIATMSRLCAQYGRPVQSLYLMQAPSGDGRPVSRFAEFAWRIKNWVRPLGGRVLGFPSALNGSGMVFPWAQISTVQVANGNLAEDYTLGLDLLRAGHAAHFSEEAVVLSQFPNSLESRQGQRRRWEHGHLDLITRTAPLLIGEALMHGNWALLGSALDLLIPPLALLALFAAVALPVAALSAVLGSTLAPLWVCLLAVVELSLALLLAWLGWGRDVVPFQLMLQIPGYALSKINVYSRYLTARERQWKRTNRD